MLKGSSKEYKEKNLKKIFSIECLDLSYFKNSFSVLLGCNRSKIIIHSTLPITSRFGPENLTLRVHYIVNAFLYFTWETMGLKSGPIIFIRYRENSL